MSTNTTNGTATPIDVATIYSDYVEPFFAILYLYVIVQIFRSAEEALKGAYYKFAITTGVCAISNVFLMVVQRLIDYRYKIMPERGLFMNIINSLSHIFGQSMTLGKILSVTVRFTTVWFPFNVNQYYSPIHTWILIAIQFALPFLLYIFMVFYPVGVKTMVHPHNCPTQAVFAPTPDGYGKYLGITTVPFKARIVFTLKVAKSFNMLFYVVFFSTTIPMCFATVTKMVKDREMISSMQGPSWSSSGGVNALRSERILVFCSVVQTMAHAVKATQQIVWFTALIIDNTALQSTMISFYMVSNTFTSFIEPVLLLISSKSLRKEVFLCLSKSKSHLTRNTGVASTIVSQNHSPRI